VLRAAGVDAVYGLPFEGVAVVPVDPPRVAGLMAEAHARVHGRTAAVHGGDGRFEVGGGLEAARAAARDAASDAADVVAATVDDLLGALGPLAAARDGGRVSLRVELDPAASMAWVSTVELGAGLPGPAAPVDRWAGVDGDGPLVRRVRGARAPVLLAGPGVVRGGGWAVPGLHALAAAANLGVLNTWGAKGVFDWRSRHHLATAGLQERDFELGGLAESDLVVASGIDPYEAPEGLWRRGPALEVEPSALGPLAEHWWRPHTPIAVPPLRAGLARVTQEGWAVERSPLPPSRVTLAYSRALGPGGLVAADPGVAGYWVARTFATTELGGVQVPGQADRHGFAVACATVARLRTPARPALAVVDAVRGEVAEAMEVAARLGVAVPVEVWSGDGETLDAAGHLARLQELAHADRSTTVTLATDPGQLARMVEVAGEVVAWGGLT
jgi:thiamine pyrophosphate-dependent acetolactate synthase large subunit-like protein